MEQTDRLTPLKELPISNCSKSLKRALGLFSYYSPWVENFSDQISPLLNITAFPITEKLKNQFQTIKMKFVRLHLQPLRMNFYS